MTTEIILTLAEQSLYNLLPDSLKEGWSVKEETLSSYESERQIVMRHRLADFTAYPQVAVMVERIVNGESFENFSISDLPDTIQNELYFMIGARGVNALMQTLLSEITTDEDVVALAALSAARHKLLEINSAATHS